MNNLSDPWSIPDREIDPPEDITEDEIDAEYERRRDDELLKGIEDTASAQSLKKLWDAELPALLKRQAG